MHSCPIVHATSNWSAGHLADALYDRRFGPVIIRGWLWSRSCAHFDLHRRRRQVSQKVNKHWYGLCGQDDQGLASPLMVTASFQLEHLFHRTRQRWFAAREVLRPRANERPARVMDIAVYGPRGGVVSFHSHGVSLNVALAGGRRWFLIRASPAAPREHDERLVMSTPGDILRALALNRSRTAATTNDWLRFATPPMKHRRLTAWECAQHGGDIVFVPARVEHAIVTIREALAAFVVEEYRVSFDGLVRNGCSRWRGMQ